MMTSESSQSRSRPKFFFWGMRVIIRHAMTLNFVTDDANMEPNEASHWPQCYEENMKREYLEG